MCPESGKNSPLKGDNYSAKNADIWALGVIIHEMLTKGIHPYGKKDIKMAPNIIKGNMEIK